MNALAVSSRVEKSLASPPPDEQVARERQARHFWVTMIVGLLSLQVAGGITAIILSASDPTIALVPNYHQAALNWDAVHRNQQLTEKLGWRTDVRVGPADPATGRRSLEVLVLDCDEMPVGDLQVAAQLFHHARGREVHRVQFVAIAGGPYVAETNLNRIGLWQVNLQLEGDHGIATVSREIEVK